MLWVGLGGGSWIPMFAVLGLFLLPIYFGFYFEYRSAQHITLERGLIRIERPSAISEVPLSSVEVIVPRASRRFGIGLVILDNRNGKRFWVPSDISNLAELRGALEKLDRGKCA